MIKLFSLTNKYAQDSCSNNFASLNFKITFKIIIKQLKDKVENIKTEIEEKTTDMNGHKEQKTEVRNELSDLITNCEQLYNEYDVVRIQVRQQTFLHVLF